MKIPFITSSLYSSTPIGHAFFSRKGGISKPPYDSLNCGVKQQDDPDDREKNFRLIAESLQMNRKNLILMDQIHSNIVHTEIHPHWDIYNPGDAMVTNRKGLMLGIITADCVPLLCADIQAGVIAAVHAGWNGAFSGIVDKTITAMEILGAKRQTIMAALGPCIHQNSYEVESDFRDKFLLQQKDNDAYFRPNINPQKWLFDLPGYVEGQLQKAGITAIDNCGIDTYKNPKDYFSYRYSSPQKQDTGRQLSVIYLK